MSSSEKKTTLVWSGMRVQVEILYEEGPEQMTLVIVPDAQADFSRGLLGEGTPLAKALLGQPVGGRVPYHQGDARWVRILAAGPAEETPGTLVAAERQERLRRNLEQIDRTNAIVFASSFSGKWGDYDPQGIENWEKQDAPEDDQPGQQKAEG
ncbi:MAG: GreA/GreB family elongation factor [Chloroflexota bacterium]